MEMWVVILFDNEEDTPSDSVLEVYGIFESKGGAEIWANEKWAAMPKEKQEFRGLTVEAVSPRDE
jgi:hypothetical protein